MTAFAVALVRIFHRHRFEHAALHVYHDGSEEVLLCRCGERRGVFRDAAGNQVDDVRCFECGEWRSTCGCAEVGR